jgi:predicted cytidylate kinase
LAVSGQCCSGKSTLCKILSEKLGWKHIDVGGEVKKLADLQGLSIERFGSIPEPLLRRIDEQIRQQIEIGANKIWDGRLSCYLARDSVKILRIYCKAPVKVRAKRCANRDMISFEDAKKKVITRDAEEVSVFKRLYNLSNLYNPAWVDLCLNTCNEPQALSEEVTRILLSFL